MSEFYGTLKGSAESAATRRGSAKTGLVARLGSWSGGVEVALYMHHGEPHVQVYLTPWSGEGRQLLIYTGPVNGAHDPSLRSAALNLLRAGNAGPLTVQAASIANPEPLTRAVVIA